MRQVTLIILGGFSIFIAFISGLCLLLISINPPVLAFAFESIDGIFLLIVPVLILIFSIKFAIYCFRALTKSELP
jgi:hypothetical protein